MDTPGAEEITDSGIKEPSSTNRLNGQKDAPLDIAATLVERGKRYGAFPDHARLTQHLKQWMREAPVWEDMCFDQKEALEMIAHKIGRILNGDPHYADSWRDIAGYAMLVASRLETKV